MSLGVQPPKKKRKEFKYKGVRDTQLVHLDVFLEQYQSPHTRRAYRNNLHCFAAYLSDQKTVFLDVNKIVAINYLSYMKDNGYSSESIRQHIYSLSAYYSFLLENDIVPKNPFHAIKLPNVSHRYESGLTDAEVIALFRVAREKPLWNAVFVTLFYQGLRRSELAGLNMGDIKRVGRFLVMIVRGKGDKTRQLVVHKETRIAIHNYVSSVKRTKAPDEDPVFLRESGVRITPFDIYNMLAKIAKLAGIGRKIHPHLIRAKFASRALESGQPITSVMHDMGHASIETTAIYDKGRTSLERSTISKMPVFGNPQKTGILEDKKNAGNGTGGVSG